MSDASPLIQYVDCVRISVPDLESGLAFYRDVMGLKVLWRLKDFIGLQMPDTQTEIVLDIHPHPPEVFFKVQSVPAAVGRLQAAGGKIIVPPYEIEVGFCAVVQDLWGNQFLLLDTSKGIFVTDSEGKVTGTQRQIEN